MPNPPPTSGAITLIRSAGIDSTSLSVLLTMCGACELSQTVSSSRYGSYWATTPRHSIGAAVIRLVRKASSTEPASNIPCASTLSGSSSWSGGPLPRTACSTSTTAGSGSYSTLTSSAASSAW